LVFFLKFVLGSAKIVMRGGLAYWAWIGMLLVLMGVGGVAYIYQMRTGLIVTSMRDPVSWGFYIGNFTFLVGVAAAAVVLVIPAYIYDWKPIKEIAVIGELLAVSAIVMCVGFVVADLGHPERGWHLIPMIGHLNLPASMLAWDVIVLNAYLVLNFFIATHVVYRMYTKRHHSKWVLPFILLSIPAAVSIHTVTAFLYAGLPARPYWNSAILAPRFLASAFCSGPAIILILLQLLRRYAHLDIQKEALWKIAELMAYAMAINLFLLGAEVFREYYSGTSHLIHHQYLYSGIGEHRSIVPFGWASLVLSVGAFLLFLIPYTRKNPITLNLGAVMIYFGVYIEKGIALVIPGFTPDTQGQIYDYRPALVELVVAMAIFSMGFLLFTMMVKVAIAVLNGNFSMETDLARSISIGKVEPAAAGGGDH
jgi:Ni/Fe-hydrogenase subunit HybB-like protein